LQLKWPNTRTRNLEILKQCSSNLAPEMFTTNETKGQLFFCHDNSFTADPVLIKTEIPSFCLNQGPFTQASLVMKVKRYGYFICSKQDPLSYFNGLKMRIFGFSLTGAIWFLLWWTCVVPSLKNMASFLPEIFFIR